MGSATLLGQRSYSRTIACLAVLVARPAYAQPAPVTISGGADASGHKYSWTVTNGASTPIVELSFPHYRAGLFFPPPGWSSECTGLVSVGAKDEPGQCTARANSPSDALAPGRSLAVQMQIAPAGARRATGTVTVLFADGTPSAVPDVELPTRESVGDKYLSLIGLTALFVAFLAIDAVRRRRRRPR